MLEKDIIELKENNLVEFKKAKGRLPNLLWESYSAFANTNGGTIVLGIDELKSNVFESANLTESEVIELLKRFWNVINNTQKVSINILVDKDVFIDKYQENFV